jgi:hypothetical protein
VGPVPQEGGIEDLEQSGPLIEIRTFDWRTQLLLWVLRVSAGAMLLAGLSALLASAVTIGTLASSPAPQRVALLALCASTVLIVAGGSAVYLSRPRGLSLPNERAEIGTSDRPAIGGPLLLLAVVLVALPAWTVLRLSGFLAEWGNVWEALDRASLWSAGSGIGGIVLLPVFAALGPPFTELLALAGFVAASAALLGALLRRSTSFPRAYLVSVVLLSGLVVVSALGAYATSLAVEALEGWMHESPPRPEEAAAIQDVLTRYIGAVVPTAPVLAWTLAGYLVWVPFLITSERVRLTFARPRTAAGSQPPDLAAITRPDRFPGY